MEGAEAWFQGRVRLSKRMGKVPGTHFWVENWRTLAQMGGSDEGRGQDIEEACRKRHSWTPLGEETLSVP